MSFYYPIAKNVDKALLQLRNLASITPLEFSPILSQVSMANIFLKREDRGPVGSYKWRGSANWFFHNKNKNSVVTCSAGNHAQGVAFACKRLGMHADIFMPNITTQQKISKVSTIGGDNVKIFLEGDCFDKSFEHASNHAQKLDLNFVHPFDNEYVIEGQATVGAEIIEQMSDKRIDYIIVPIGGGGLSAGISSYLKQISPETRVIGVQPLGAPSMRVSMDRGQIITLNHINKFVDGAAVKKVGKLNFPICSAFLHDIILIDEGHVCSKIVQMYNESSIIIEPAGVLSLCALDKLNLKGSNVVCIVSGGNSDAFRMPEILERALIYEGKKHYFKIELPQKAGALRNFLLNVLSDGDDIIYFRYTKQINKELGPILIGIETKTRENGDLLLTNMDFHGVIYEKLPKLL
jgi:threonine dehydratase